MKLSNRDKHLKVLTGIERELFKAPIDQTYPDKTDPVHLLGMCYKMRNWGDMPEDKMARWVGFIQGVMAARGWVSVNAERDRTRPIFGEAE